MLMLAHVSPEADSYGETISTLKFAQRASTVELGAPRQNKESSEIQELKEQVAQSFLAPFYSFLNILDFDYFISCMCSVVGGPLNIKC